MLAFIERTGSPQTGVAPPTATSGETSPRTPFGIYTDGVNASLFTPATLEAARDAGVVVIAGVDEDLLADEQRGGDALCSGRDHCSVDGYAHQRLPFFSRVKNFTSTSAPRP